MCTYTDDTVDLYHHGHDHATCCMGVVAQTNVPCRGPSRSLPFDPSKLHDVGGQEAFRAHMGRLRPICWQVDVDSHWHALRQWILEGLCEAFPRGSFSQAKCQWMSDATLHVVHARKAAIHRCKSVRRNLHMSTLRLLLTLRQGLRCKRGPVFFVKKAQQWECHIVKCEREVAMRLKYLDISKPVLETYISNDNKYHVCGVVAEMTAAAKRHDPQNMYELIKSLQPYKPRYRPVMAAFHDECKGSTEAESWQSFFAEKCVGRVCEYEAIVNSNRDACHAHIRMPSCTDLTNIMTIGDIACCMARKNPRKARSSDLIPPSVLMAFPVDLALAVHPLITKVAVHAVEPVMWSGATLVAIHKGKAAPQLPDSYRGISVADAMPKVLSGFLRGRLLQNLIPHSPGSQCCGLLGKSTDVAALAVRAFIGGCHARRLPGAVLFVDVKGAFDGVVRELLYGRGDTHAAWLGRIEDLFASGLVSEDAPRVLEERPILVEAGCGPHLVRLLAATYRNVWCVTDGAPSPASVPRGTVQGRPVADVLFWVSRGACDSRGWCGALSTGHHCAHECFHGAWAQSF